MWLLAHTSVVVFIDNIQEKYKLTNKVGWIDWKIFQVEAV